MKVCTDACLFGALIAQQIRNPPPDRISRAGKSEIRNVLDIGTGTGLLSLMLAQKNPHVIIDAVEIDVAAAQQAKENFEASPWKDRLHVYHTSIQQFNPSTIQPFNQSTTPPFNHSTTQPLNQPTKYDLILSNSPFFENDLKSDNARRNLALHSSELSLEELLNVVIKHLNDDGSFAVLLPYHRMQQFNNLATQQSLHLSEKILVKQTPAHNYFRSMLCFTKEPTSTQQSEIIIQNEEGKYTIEFVELLKDYYLYL